VPRAYLPTTVSTTMTNGMYVVQKIITKAIFFTGHEVIRAETYDRWTNLLVRSCWNFPYPWSNLELLPFRSCRRVSVARIRVATCARQSIIADPLARTYRFVVRCGGAGTFRTARTFLAALRSVGASSER
jgi:hypothetical protein